MVDEVVIDGPRAGRGDERDESAQTQAQVLEPVDGCVDPPVGVFDSVEQPALGLDDGHSPLLTHECRDLADAHSERGRYGVA